MQQIETILQFLDEKKSLFLQFEQESEQMCFCLPDEIEGHMEQRLALQKKIQDLDQQLSALYESLPEAAQAVSNQEDFSDLPATLRPVYDRSLEIKGVINRILQNEPMLKERLELERADLLKKLEENKKSSGSVAQKYYNSIHTGINKPYFAQKVTKA